MGPPASRRAIGRTRTLRRVDLREQRRFLAAGPVAVQAAAGADNRFGSTLADHEGLAAAPAALRTSVREKWRDLFHDDDSDE